MSGADGARFRRRHRSLPDAECARADGAEALAGRRARVLYGPSLQDVHVPEHAPPLFVAVGATHFNVTNGCLALFAAWRAAAKPAEIHVYDGVSAGFGMSKRSLPVDGWTERLYEWLVARQLTRIAE